MMHRIGKTSSGIPMFLAALLILAAPLRASDWPQYRGPTDDGITPERISTTWLHAGPKLLWRAPVGAAFGSFAVGEGKAFYFAERDGKEVCFALDPDTGKPLWSTEIDKTIHEHSGGDGPRSTPTVSGNSVYVLGTYLKLFCLNVEDGSVRWSHDLDAEFSGQSRTSGIDSWGNAASPVVEGNLVLVAGGGKGESLLAFDKTSGKLAWKGEDEKITHASPTAATIAGTRQVIFFMQSGLVSVAPQTGEVLWRQPFKFSVSTAASPVVANNIVYCSAGYGVGAGAYRIAASGKRFTSTEVWRMPGKNINHWSTPVYHDGCIYGLFGFKEFGKMPLKCIDLATGREKWSEPGFGQGGLILVGNDLLVQGDKGQLVLVSAAPDGYHELARTDPLAGQKCWQMPVVAGGRIYTRSTKEAVCLDVSGK